jgi:hypothetical protein
VAALALLAGLSLGRPELVAVAAPLAVLVVAGLAGARDPELDAEVRVDRERALVGDQVTVTLDLRAVTGSSAWRCCWSSPRAWRARGRPADLGGGRDPGRGEERDPADRRHLPPLGRLLARRRPPAGP